MELKQRTVRVIVKKQPHDNNIRIEVKDKDKENKGRKVFSFTIYGTTLEDVMRFMVTAFEKRTGNEFNPKIKQELGMLDDK